MSATARHIMRSFILGLIEYWFSQDRQPKFITFCVYDRDMAILPHGKRVRVEFHLEDWEALR